MTWKWETGTWHERANMVRTHAGGFRPITTESLLELFQLTPEGLDRIVRGADWCPEFQATVTAGK